MKIILIFLIVLLYSGCYDSNKSRKLDTMFIAKINFLCKDHNEARETYYSGYDKYLLCKDGFVIKNYNLDEVYGPEVYQNYIKLEKEGE